MEDFIEVKTNLPPMQKWVDEMMGQLAHLSPSGTKPSRKDMCKQYAMLKNDTVFTNGQYQVNVDYDSEENGALSPDPSVRVIHLSIRRLDREPIMDYRDLMDIKDKLVGEQFEAIMLYPARQREHDMANQYHLWVPVFRDGGEPVGIPFGWNCGRKVIDQTLDGITKQRGK
tara:strand:- start:718 stop:1230 length:513 start_codon:yes stop_codon:yes gene_type:complete